jgi:hypothetical protein
LGLRHVNIAAANAAGFDFNNHLSHNDHHQTVKHMNLSQNLQFIFEDREKKFKRCSKVRNA